MGRHLVAVLPIVLGIATPAAAQTAIGLPPPPAAVQVTRTDVVERLMSFDVNHDGRLALIELPDRLHLLFERGDLDNDQTLDSVETVRLAEQPVQIHVARGSEPGRYGFAEGSFFDSRLHIEGAIDDLRLAQDNRERALAVAQRFNIAREERTRSELLKTMAQMLTSDSFDGFKAAVDRLAAPNAARGSANAARIEVSPARVGVCDDCPDVRAELVQTMRSIQRHLAGNSLIRLIDKYGLQVAEQQQALHAIERYNDAIDGRLGDADRVALLEQLRTVLDVQQLDDLRAALERRPVVKQGVIARK